MQHSAIGKVCSVEAVAHGKALNTLQRILKAGHCVCLVTRLISVMENQLSLQKLRIMWRFENQVLQNIDKSNSLIPAWLFDILRRHIPKLNLREDAIPKVSIFSVIKIEI